MTIGASSPELAAIFFDQPPGQRSHAATAGYAACSARKRSDLRRQMRSSKWSWPRLQRLPSHGMEQRVANDWWPSRAAFARTRNACTSRFARRANRRLRRNDRSSVAQITISSCNVRMVGSQPRRGQERTARRATMACLSSLEVGAKPEPAALPRSGMEPQIDPQGLRQRAKRARACVERSLPCASGTK